MDSLVSTFKRLNSHEGQPEPELRKGIATVAASRSPHTPSALERDTPQPECQLANPASPSLETLPVEIQIQILAGVTSLESLRTLVHTSPTLHHIYVNNRLPILKGVLEHTLDGISVDARATHQSWSWDFDLDDYKERLLAASTEPILKGISLTEATKIASFYLSVVKPLTDRYTTWALSALSSSPAAFPLSQTEKARIQRAIYRLQTICNMKLRKPAEVLEALSIFAPWEAEEVLCIYEFAKEKYSSVFFITAWDLNQDKNPRYSSICINSVNGALLLYKDGSDDMQYINEGSLASILYQGLRVLAEVFNAEGYELVVVVEEHLSTYLIHEDNWIEGAAECGDQDRRRYEAYNDYDEAQDSQQKMPFERDALSAPPIAWVRFWNGLYSNLIGKYIPKVLRRWGYVMWDAKRLENAGAMEYIDLEWENMYGVREGPNAHDIRESFWEEYVYWKSNGLVPE